MATLNARWGVWHCTSDLSRDGYGRILWDCPDLAVDHLSKGLAHAMNVDDEPARAELGSAATRLTVSSTVVLMARSAAWRASVMSMP